MSGNGQYQEVRPVSIITDGRSRALARPIQQHLSSRGYPTRIINSAAAGEQDEFKACRDAQEAFTGNALGVLISSSGSGLGMALNKCPGVSVTTCFTENMAAEVAKLHGVNGCEVFAGQPIEELLRIIDRYVDTAQGKVS